MFVICNKATAMCPQECQHRQPHKPVWDYHFGPDDIWTGLCHQDVSECGFFMEEDLNTHDLIETRCMPINIAEGK